MEQSRCLPYPLEWFRILSSALPPLQEPGPVRALHLCELRFALKKPPTAVDPRGHVPYLQ